MNNSRLTKVVCVVVSMAMAIQVGGAGAASLAKSLLALMQGPPLPQYSQRPGEAWYGRHPGRESRTLRFEDGSVVETTADHPFYVEGVGFVPAGKLTFVDRIAQDDGETSFVTAITRINRGTTVYNFAVAGSRTYFVVAGDKGIWVHNNACEFKPTLSAIKRALRKAQTEVGGSIGGSGKSAGKFGSPERRLGKRGYRIDPPHPTAITGQLKEVGI